jgi:hypothetical protein
LQLNDVMVVDIFGKVKDGTVVGDNLGTATRSRTVWRCYRWRFATRDWFN